MPVPFDNGKKRKLDEEASSDSTDTSTFDIQQKRLRHATSSGDTQVGSSKDTLSAQTNSEPGPSKTSDVGPNPSTTAGTNNSSTRRKRKRKSKAEMKDKLGAGPRSQRVEIRKLVPPRPFPTVPTSSSATGPRSSHAEGKNRLCITRKTKLGFYLRRCKELILKDGYVSYEIVCLPCCMFNHLQL